VLIYNKYILVRACVYAYSCFTVHMTYQELTYIWPTGQHGRTPSIVLEATANTQQKRLLSLVHSDVTTSRATHTPRIIHCSHYTLERWTCKRSSYVQITFFSVFWPRKASSYQKTVNDYRNVEWPVTTSLGMTSQLRKDGPNNKRSISNEISNIAAHIGGLWGVQFWRDGSFFYTDAARLKMEASWKWYSEVNFICQRDTKVPITVCHNMPLRSALKSVSTHA
jgi:hypothetical protein